MMESTDGSATADGTGIVEVGFSIDDGGYPFTGSDGDESPTYELTDLLPRDDGYCAEFFNVSGARPEHVVETVSAYDGVEAMLLAEYDDGGLYEFQIGGDCPALDLAERGGLPRTVRGSGGTGRIVAEIPVEHDPSAVIEAFLEKYPGMDLVAKRRKDAVTPRYSRAAFEGVSTEVLTERQQEVVQTAFEAGYYEWPRQCTGEDVAEELGISSATVSEHIHAAERKLFALMFAGGLPEGNQDSGDS